MTEFLAIEGSGTLADEMTHALRSLRSVFHGFATLQATGGSQWSVDIDESLDWLIDLVDHGLRATTAS